MTLHLQKLCVGCDSVEDLASWIDERMAEKRRRGLPEEHVHTTRMSPKRVEELLDGGSLYWIIKGAILARQPLLDLRAVKGADGVTRCELVLAHELVPVRPAPRRPFQGWRYLAAADAPRDLEDAAAAAPGLPAALAQELRSLGLL
ncbi:DUF1489 family protein [Methylopila turkensis]|uniref:Lysophospholipase n=1 Tax=Methylopila turkensis TaxID=1437816 RepID=A0A9W6JNW0_9HYPH|nr:DUF1489 domain-containing protein [Methylopila turkensis]GLK81075.1 hypothetical protein GCM10008174_28160 [Methylopila turkensis]